MDTAFRHPGLVVLRKELPVLHIIKSFSFRGHDVSAPGKREEGREKRREHKLEQQPQEETQLMKSRAHPTSDNAGRYNTTLAGEDHQQHSTTSSRSCVISARWNSRLNPFVTTGLPGADKGTAGIPVSFPPLKAMMTPAFS